MSRFNPECPYCGHFYSFSKLSYYDLTWCGDAAEKDLKCFKCGKEYRVHAEVEYVFSCTTSKIDEKGGA